MVARGPVGKHVCSVEVAPQGSAGYSVAAPIRHVHALDMVRPDEEFDWEFFDPNRLVAHLVEASPK